MSAQPLIFLAAGGTGGHVFPAEALAQALKDKAVRLALITDRRGTGYGGTLGDLETHAVRAGGVAGRGITGRARGLVELALGTVQAFVLLRRLRPAVVVGFGGYASLPAMLAAIRLKIPTLIHEQNGVLGRANRLLAKRVRTIATSLPDVSHLPAKAVLVRSGMPVRDAVRVLAASPYAAPRQDQTFNLLVFGGSQGARVFSTLIPDALAGLPEALRQRLRVVQQARPETLEDTKARYAALGIEVELAPFFGDMPERIRDAHLVIGRAGASTVAEITVIGRPAILIPYPHAIDDHQTANARSVDERGGAWLMTEASLTAATLTARLESLMSQPDTLAKTAAAAQRVGIPDAADKLAEAVLALVPGGSHA